MKTEQETKVYDENKMLASKVSAWTKEAGTMLPKEPEEILKMIMGGCSVVVWEHGGREPKLIGFGAVTFEYSDNWKEIGCIIVDKDSRKAGIGHKIVGSVIQVAKETYPEAKLFALCNEKSLKLFLDNGGEIITDPGILPIEVFGECVSCPKFQEAKNQNKLCCDIPVMIK